VDHAGSQDWQEGSFRCEQGASGRADEFGVEDGSRISSFAGGRQAKGPVMTSAEANKDRSQTITVVVNAEQKVVEKNDELTFDEVVDLAFTPRPVGAQIVYTITYYRGHGEKPEGHLLEGKSVKAKDGMVFNVKYTDKS
jgi:multiubiquitin